MYSPLWQEAAGGVPLAEVNSPVGLLLADVCTALGLLPEETAQVLEGETFIEAIHVKVPEFEPVGVSL